MKPKKLFLLFALIAALNLLSVGQAPAQTFRTLHRLHVAIRHQPRFARGLEHLFTRAARTRQPEHRH